MKGSLEGDTVLTLYKVTLNQLIFLLLLVKGKRKADSTEKSVTKKAKLVNDGMSDAMTALSCDVLSVDTSLLRYFRLLCLCWKPE